MESSINFANSFQALSGGLTPLLWQERLFTKFTSGRVPPACTLPTGLGKTAIIQVWLIALACGEKLPRRLVYIVNRRTVVDQASEVAAMVRARLESPGDPRWSSHATALLDLANGLRRVSGSLASEPPLAISTLRGELADNGEWKKDPARPAIIIGTIDMIGSKLLFSGYGDGRYGRAHHAGLIGQDAFVVHDEAHLEPAFDVLLRSVAAEQAQCGEARPIRVMSLSATTRTGGNGGAPFTIEDQDRRDPIVAQRLCARKSLTILDVDKGKVTSRIAEEAQKLGASPSRVLVYVRSPNDVTKIAEAIEKRLGDGGGTRVARLTGTIRGSERDELAESEVFRAFKAGADRSSPLSHSLYLISTSAGEVGADLDADHLVCDLSTLDSMAQRFGRVNRLGGDERQAQVVVVMESAANGNVGARSGEVSQDRKGKAARTANSYEASVLKTGEMLRGVAHNGGDVSPAALDAFFQKLSDDNKKAAFSPEPTILPATDILFDHWSLTSIAGEMPGRPEVGPYLHGVAEWEPAETRVAWRADLTLLAAAGGKDVPCLPTDLEAVFDAFPLISVEQLRDRADRVQAELREIAERLRKAAERCTIPSPPIDSTDSDESSDLHGDDVGESEASARKDTPIGPNPWIVLMRGGSVEWVRLEDIAPKDKDDAKRAQRRLSFATVVLPVEAGGLKGGMLDGRERPPLDARTLDVAEIARDGIQSRQRLVDGGPLLCGAAIAGVAHLTISLAGESDEDSEPTMLEYRVARGHPREPGERIGLSVHCDAVSSTAKRTAVVLGMDDTTVRAVGLAGWLHDTGKSRTIWQRFANNFPHRDEPGGPIAKSDCYGHWKQLAGYRHELGSLHDASTEKDIRSLDPDTRDLVFHLIAAHHAWARPHFEPRHFDHGDLPSGMPRSTADNERLAVETMQRFARLQQRYGRWGLAWLESILRCADSTASESPAQGDTGIISSRDGAPGGVA